MTRLAPYLSRVLFWISSLSTPSSFLAFIHLGTSGLQSNIPTVCNGSFSTMPRSAPHPLALFSLKPCNTRAYKVVANSTNDHLASILEDGQIGLNIGHVHPTSGNPTTLATLGQTGDIIMQEPSIARIQCSFEIDPNTNIVMLYDRSHSLSTQVFGDNATPFECGRPRKVVVQKGLNTIIGMGGEKRDIVLFKLDWHCDPAAVMEKVKARGSATLEVNPRLADTVLLLRRQTRPHTTGPRQPRMRYQKMRDQPLGSGQSGHVYEAVDVDTGKLMAVKIVKRPTRALFGALKREVEAPSKISYVSTASFPP